MNLRKDQLYESKLSTPNLTVSVSLRSRIRGRLAAVPRGSWLGADAHLFFNLIFSVKLLKNFTTLSDGCLGSGNDEGRRKMR